MGRRPELQDNFGKERGEMTISVVFVCFRIWIMNKINKHG